MASASSSGFALTNTRIMVEGAESNLIFYNLVAHQALADVNSFTFIWRQPGGKASFANYVQFYQKYLAKEVTIHIGNTVSIKGIITSITCVEADELGIHYEIKGKGLFAKLDQSPDCNIFLKKTIKDIFTALNTAGLSLTLTPASTAKLHYTVQYNQTTFEFFRMMAIRHGEWLYDNGKELVLGPPEKKASVSLQMDTDLNNLNLSTYAMSGAVKSSGYDQRKGDELKRNSTSSPGGSDLMTLSLKGGDSVFAKQTNGISIPHLTATDLHTSVNELRQKSLAAATVYISAHSYCNGIRLGSRLNVKDINGGSAGDYIITEIHHFCSSNNSYENQFSAVPAEVEVPPYTDPLLYPICKAQLATVNDNADPDGLDRIKVKFPWSESSDMPWINVLTPHAGKDKGIRFLPEIGEEVMIGFIDDNAEKPFFMGAIHTEKNKSSDPEKGNDIKTVGTRSGRRIEFDDKKGLLRFTDSPKEEQPKNALTFERNDQKVSALLRSGKTANDYSAVDLTNGESMAVTVFSGGTAVAEIKLTSSDKKILIHAMGDIEIKADQNMKLSAQNISINAMQEVKIEGTAGVSAKGAKMALEANSTMDIKGTTTTVEGTAKVDLKAAGIASIVGAMVKIN